MVERATTIMGEPGPQGEPGQPAEQQKGSSLLGTLLRLGIGAFAIKFLWPAILPALKGVLAGVLKGVFSWTGLKLAALLGGIIGSIPLIGKFGPKIKDGIVDTFSGISSWVENLVKGVDKDGRVSDGAGGGTGNPTNVRGSGARQPLLEGGESMEKTLTEKDLVKGKPIKNKRGRIIGYEEAEETEVDKVSSIDEAERNFNPETQEHEYSGGDNPVKSKQTVLKSEIKLLELDRKTEIAQGAPDFIIKEDFDIPLNKLKKEYNDTLEYGGYELTPVNNQSKIEVETKNKNLDLSSDNVDGDMTQAIAKTNERIDNLIGGENKEQNNGNLVSANKPNVTEATLKVAAAPLPFVKVIKNNQLSTSPKSYNGLPPEIAAMIS